MSDHKKTNEALERAQEEFHGKESEATIKHRAEHRQGLIADEKKLERIKKGHVVKGKYNG